MATSLLPGGLEQQPQNIGVHDIGFARRGFNWLRRGLRSVYDWLDTLTLSVSAAEKAPWALMQVDGKWHLSRGGSAIEIRGVSGWDYVRLEDLVAMGGNAIRAIAHRRGLNQAHKLGLSVLVNLPTRGEMSGFDWGDPREVARQQQRIVRIVKRLKNHPAVMAWSVGNELDHLPHRPDEVVPHHKDLWKHVNALAVVIKKVDPLHPVCLCIDQVNIENKIQDIVSECPALDLIGLNCFWQTRKTPALMNKYWERPYFFSEWGSPPPWRAPRTEWQAPIELPSSKKAATISERYQRMVLGNEYCVGSFLFFWGERAERTQTWFGLFRDGMHTEPIDVMTRFWTGSWPLNRAPGVLGISVGGHRGPTDIRLCPNREYHAEVVCFDPDGDKMEIAWHVRREAVRPFGAYAGKKETHADPIAGLILGQEEKTVRFAAPWEAGVYRLYVQVSDDKGGAGYANVPFLIEGESAEPQ